MKYLRRALGIGIGPLFVSRDTGEALSEEAEAEFVQVARFLLDGPSFTLPDETTATPLELEDAQEAIAVVLFKLREHAAGLETRIKQRELDALQLEADALLPYAKLGVRKRKRQQKATSQSIKSRRTLADETADRVVRKALSFRQAGKADCELSGSVAESLKLSSKHVREVLQEHKILPPKKNVPEHN
jgi:hypothetical protein